MKYVMLIYQGPALERQAALPEEEQKQVYADYQAINETAGVSSGLQMQSPETATTVRVEDGETLTTDGPFVAIKEALGGYLFFEADDVDDASELASRMPAARLRKMSVQPSLTKSSVNGLPSTMLAKLRRRSACQPG